VKSLEKRVLGGVSLGGKEGGRLFEEKEKPLYYLFGEEGALFLKRFLKNSAGKELFYF